MAKKGFIVIDMPEDCNNCIFYNDDLDYPYCIITRETRGYTFNPRGNKMKNCPIFTMPNCSNDYQIEGFGKFLKVMFGSE